MPAWATPQCRLSAQHYYEWRKREKTRRYIAAVACFDGSWWLKARINRTLFFSHFHLKTIRNGNVWVCARACVRWLINQITKPLTHRRRRSRRRRFSLTMIVRPFRRQNHSAKIILNFVSCRNCLQERRNALMASKRNNKKHHKKYLLAHFAHEMKRHNRWHLTLWYVRQEPSHSPPLSPSIFSLSPSLFCFTFVQSLSPLLLIWSHLKLWH